MMSVQRSAVALLLVVTFAAHAQTSADALQRAAEGNDYRAFREALDAAKDPKQVYRDIDAVWSEEARERRRLMREKARAKG